MIRFLTFLLLIISGTGMTNAQNLIPDWSAEDNYECPYGLGFVEYFLNDWFSYRGSPDYFHSCCELPQLCWNNSLGYQEPRTGEGYIGTVLYSRNLSNAREYFGIEFTEPLTVGQSYYISFHTSFAFSATGGSRYVTNKLGFLLMTDNYIDPNEQGTVTNFAHYSIDTAITDTLDWIKVSTTIVADSAYTQIAFGNFFDDQSIEVTEPFGAFTSGVAYHYFDDFCVSTDSLGCESFLSASDNTEVNLSIFPNPCQRQVQFISSTKITGVDIFDATGQKIKSLASINTTQGKLDMNFPAGIYMTQFYTNKGYTTKRIMVQ